MSGKNRKRKNRKRKNEADNEEIGHQISKKAKREIPARQETGTKKRKKTTQRKVKRIKITKCTKIIVESSKITKNTENKVKSSKSTVAPIIVKVCNRVDLSKAIKITKVMVDKSCVEIVDKMFKYISWVLDKKKCKKSSRRRAKGKKRRRIHASSKRIKNKNASDIPASSKKKKNKNASDIPVSSKKKKVRFAEEIDVLSNKKQREQINATAEEIRNAFDTTGEICIDEQEQINATAEEIHNAFDTTGEICIDEQEQINATAEEINNAFDTTDEICIEEQEETCASAENIHNEFDTTGTISVEQEEVGASAEQVNNVDTTATFSVKKKEEIIATLEKSLNPFDTADAFSIQEIDFHKIGFEVDLKLACDAERKQILKDLAKSISQLERLTLSSDTATVEDADSTSSCSSTEEGFNLADVESNVSSDIEAEDYLCIYLRRHALVKRRKKKGKHNKGSKKKKGKGRWFPWASKKKRRSFMLSRGGEIVVEEFPSKKPKENRTKRKNVKDNVEKEDTTKEKDKRIEKRVREEETAILEKERARKKEEKRAILEKERARKKEEREQIKREVEEFKKLSNKLNTYLSSLSFPEDFDDEEIFISVVQQLLEEKEKYVKKNSINLMKEDERSSYPELIMAIQKMMKDSLKVIYREALVFCEGNSENGSTSCTGLQLEEIIECCDDYFLFFLKSIMTDSASCDSLFLAVLNHLKGSISSFNKIHPFLLLTIFSNYPKANCLVLFKFLNICQVIFSANFNYSYFLPYLQNLKSFLNFSMFEVYHNTDINDIHYLLRKEAARFYAEVVEKYFSREKKTVVTHLIRTIINEESKFCACYGALCAVHYMGLITEAEVIPEVFPVLVEKLKLVNCFAKNPLVPLFEDDLKDFEDINYLKIVENDFLLIESEQYDDTPDLSAWENQSEYDSDDDSLLIDTQHKNHPENFSEKESIESKRLKNQSEGNSENIISCVYSNTLIQHEPDECQSENISPLANKSPLPSVGVVQVSGNKLPLISHENRESSPILENKNCEKDSLFGHKHVHNSAKEVQSEQCFGNNLQDPCEILFENNVKSVLSLPHENHSEYIGCIADNKLRHRSLSESSSEIHFRLNNKDQIVVEPPLRLAEMSCENNNSLLKQKEVVSSEVLDYNELNTRFKNMKCSRTDMPNRRFNTPSRYLPNVDTASVKRKESKKPITKKDESSSNEVFDMQCMVRKHVFRPLNDVQGKDEYFEKRFDTIVPSENEYAHLIKEELLGACSRLTNKYIKDFFNSTKAAYPLHIVVRHSVSSNTVEAFLDLFGQELKNRIPLKYAYQDLPVNSDICIRKLLKELKCTEKLRLLH